MLLALSFPVEAQQPTKIPRIGYLTLAGPSPSQALLQGLRDLGYVVGQNIAIEYRSADGKRDRLPDLAAELVRLKVDIIVADGSGPSLEAKKATSTIPIVMMSSTDPIGNGLIGSLARPGGNVTGLTSITGELGGKLLELLKESVPRLSRVAIVSSGGDANVLFVKETEPPARALEVNLYTRWFEDRKILRAHLKPLPSNESMACCRGSGRVSSRLNTSDLWSLP